MSDTGMAALNNAQIYYETAGEGEPFVMIHAGVADSRQWNNAFAYFSTGGQGRGSYRCIRYDLRGFGKSEPVAGEYSLLQDLTTLLDFLQVDQPVILMGCSMGGTLAMDFALEHPEKVKALIMVGSGPSGLELDVPEPQEEFEALEKAFGSGDLDRAAEIETHIWFDGIRRSPAQVDQDMRRLAYEMNYNDLLLADRKLGTRIPDTQTPAAGRIQALTIPLLVIVGAEDLPYLRAAADYMVEKIPTARKVVIEDAAHMPNLDHPEEFQRILEAFLEEAAR